MLQHLYNTYGKITKDLIERNRKEMNIPYNVTLPIETLFAQIEDSVDFVDAARSPYSQAQILNTAFLLVKKRVFSTRNAASGERGQRPIKPGKTLNVSLKRHKMTIKRTMP